MIVVFSKDSKVSTFFKLMREIYDDGSGKGVAKVRSTFEREMKLAHDGFDLIWSEYTLWESDKEVLSNRKQLYEEAKEKW